MLLSLSWGELRLYVECQHAGWEFVGNKTTQKYYRLFAILGAKGFEEYLEGLMSLTSVPGPQTIHLRQSSEPSN